MITLKEFLKLYSISNTINPIYIDVYLKPTEELVQKDIEKDILLFSIEYHHIEKINVYEKMIDFIPKIWSEESLVVGYSTKLVNSDDYVNTKMIIEITCSNKDSSSIIDKIMKNLTYFEIIFKNREIIEIIHHKKY